MTHQNTNIESIYSHNDFMWVRREPNIDFTLVKPSGEKFSNPVEESKRAARLIVERSGEKKVSLCLSGGLDSECMLQAFLEAKLEFEVTIMRFANKLNMHDIDSAEKLCQELNLKPQYIDLDIIKFYENGDFLQYADVSKSASPQIAIHSYLALNTTYTPVFGGDFFYAHNNLIYFNEKPTSLKVPEYKDYSVDRALKSKGRFGVAQFFNYSFEIIESMLSHTRAGRSANFDNSGIFKKYDFKRAVYRDAGFKFKMWPERTKLTGFEQVKSYFAEKHGDLDAYEKIFRKPLEDKFGKTSEQMIVAVGKKHDCYMANLVRELSHNLAEEKRLGITRELP